MKDAPCLRQIYCVQHMPDKADYLGFAFGEGSHSRCSSESPPIMLTCPCIEHPLTPNIYIVKLGFTGVYIIFLFLL